MFVATLEKKKSQAVARRRPQQRRSRQTVEAVLDAVTRLLKRGGTRALTTNRIAEVAGVSIGSVYQYFPNKEAIYQAIHDRHVEQMGRIVEKSLIDHAGAPLDALVTALVEAMIAAHASDPELHELLFAQIPPRLRRTTAGAAEPSPRSPGRAKEALPGALRLALSSRPKNEHRFPLRGSPRDLERTLFVLAHMIESLTHAAVLDRPAGMSLAVATREVIRAVLACLHA